jgi:hypothetical protein
LVAVVVVVELQQALAAPVAQNQLGIPVLPVHPAL